jgi:hypothetical protein
MTKDEVRIKVECSSQGIESFLFISEFFEQDCVQVVEYWIETV